jgi:superfamily I DNA/RNA helicase
MRLAMVHRWSFTSSRAQVRLSPSSVMRFVRSLRASRMRTYYDAPQLADIPNLRRVRAFEFTFRPGVDVTDVRQVKGLEYDYVVLVDVNATTYGKDDESRHLLHIGATRAAHQLWIITTAEPSPLLPESLRG